MVDLWSDRRIRAGDNWRREIIDALESTKVAVMLISADFLASDFIINVELPMLLKRSMELGAEIVPIIVNHCMFEESDLSAYQAINDPRKPLSSLSPSQQEEVFLKLARRVKGSY